MNACASHTTQTCLHVHTSHTWHRHAHMYACPPHTSQTGPHVHTHAHTSQTGPHMYMPTTHQTCPHVYIIHVIDMPTHVHAHHTHSTHSALHPCHSPLEAPGPPGDGDKAVRDSLARPCPCPPPSGASPGHGTLPVLVGPAGDLRWGILGSSSGRRCGGSHTGTGTCPGLCVAPGSLQTRVREERVLWTVAAGWTSCPRENQVPAPASLTATPATALGSAFTSA